MRVGALFVAAALLGGVGCAEHTDEPEPVLVAAGGFSAPRFTPDGQSLLVTGPKRVGHWRIDLRDPGAEPREASPRAATAESAKPVAFAHRDRLYVRTRHGLVVFADGDRYFGPVDSPDRRRVAFQGLATGIYVYDLDTGALTHVGAGTAPAWAPDSRQLAFERTTDDGQEITTSSLWVWQASTAARQVFATDDVIARRPAWSPDGRTLAFDDGRGAIYLLVEEAWQ